MKSFQHFYEYDMFGYTVRLYFNGSTKKGTLFGLIVTLIYIFTFIAVTIYYITQTFNRKNYTFSTSTMEHEEITSIKLDKDIFALNFALQDPINYLEFIDETIYTIKANLITGKRDPVSQIFIWNYEEIKTGPCTLDMFGKNYQQFFKNNYKSKYCLYDIDKKNLTGHFNFNYYSQILISFYSCINSTENNNHCKSKDVIDYYLNNTYVSLFIHSITIDEKQISMTRNSLENQYTTVGQNFFKDYQIYLKIIETEDDNGIIFKSEKLKKLLQFDSTREMTAINPKVFDDSFCDITIKLSSKKTVYKKSYEKLLDAFFKSGNIMTVIYYILKICLWLPVKTVYEINAINKVFRFDKAKIIKKISEGNISKILSNFNSNSQILKNEIKENNLNILKFKNDEDNKDNSKNVSNPECLYSKNNPALNIKMKNIKDNHSGSSANVDNKNIPKNIFLLKNIKSQKNYLSNSNSFNYFRENIEKENKIKRKNINKQEESKFFFETIKINWYQFLCYYPIKQCSNNNKIKLAEKGRKFYMQNLDIINVFQNLMRMRKLHEYILKNKKIFGLSENNNISNYDKLIISENKHDYS